MNLSSRIEKLESKFGMQDEINSIFIVYVPGPADDPDGQIRAAGIQSIEYGRYHDSENQRWTRNEGESEEAFKARAMTEAKLEPGRVGRFVADYRSQARRAR